MCRAFAGTSTRRKAVLGPLLTLKDSLPAWRECSRQRVYAYGSPGNLGILGSAIFRKRPGLAPDFLWLFHDGVTSLLRNSASDLPLSYSHAALTPLEI